MTRSATLMLASLASTSIRRCSLTQAFGSTITTSGDSQPPLNIFPQYIKEALENDAGEGTRELLFENLSAIHQHNADLAGGSVNVDVINNQVDNYYLPMFAYINTLYKQKNGSDRTGPLMIGISAPQGCGKTTMTDLLEAAFRAQGKSVATMSLDDFYLTFEDQNALAAEHKGNHMLEFRGNAGSHDMPLINTTIHALQAGQEVAVPRYDKALNEGRGDRAPKHRWVQRFSKDHSADIVLFEGWMLGFEATTDEEIGGEHAAQVKEVNAFLAGYDKLHRAFDGWVVIQLSDLNLVYTWRQQAEKSLGTGTLSEAQVTDFVNRFMPAYKQYLPSLYEKGPQRTLGIPVLSLTIDASRSPLRVDLL
jgi:D-glycerate 3-kinase